MKTHDIYFTTWRAAEAAAQAARQAAQQRRRRNAELRKLFSGGAMVFAGLLIAALYCLLTHQIPI